MIAVVRRPGAAATRSRRCGKAASDSVTTGIGAIFILLAVGALIGTWALSGTLVAMVYYGLQLLSPNYFYVTACADLRASSPLASAAPGPSSAPSASG